MLRIFCGLLIAGSIALGQSSNPFGTSTGARQGAAAPAASVPSGAPGSDVFRKEYLGLQKAVDGAMGEIPGTSILQISKATYLEGFGIVVVLEISLEPPRNPFDIANPNAGRSLSEKQRLVRAKVQQFLTQKAPTVQSLAPEESLVVAVHIFNSNPVDTKLPAQMIFKVKKQEPSQVVLREL